MKWNGPKPKPKKKKDLDALAISLICEFKTRLADTHPAVKEFLDNHGAYVNLMGSGHCVLLTVRTNGWIRSSFFPPMCLADIAIADVIKNAEIVSPTPD